MHARFISAIFSKATGTAVAATQRSELVAFSQPNDIRTVAPHIGSAVYLESADDGNMFAAYGSSEVVEIWGSRPLSRQRVISTGQGAISRVTFTNESDGFVTAGRDGTLIYRTSSGVPQKVIRLNQPITDFVLMHGAKSALISTADGAIWQADDTGNTAQLRGGGVQVTRILRIPGTLSVGIAYANGVVVILDTSSRGQALVLHVAQTIRDVAFTSDGHTIALVDNDDIVHVGRSNGSTWTNDKVTWIAFALRARKLALTSDGLLVALGSDGTVWLYSSTHKSWLCLPTGTADLDVVAMSPDGKNAATFDSDGRMVWLDLELARKTLTNTLNPNAREQILQ